jgi:ATP-dependent exoDNAse (exonuclease V) beta subunit
MNLFYVALTRAEEKLFVFSKDSTTETATTPQFLLKLFVESTDDFRPTGFDGEFSFGENWQKNTTTSLKPKDQANLKKLFSRSWSDALRVASKQESRGGTTYEKRERGKLFHGVMEKIITVQDIQPVLQWFVLQGQLDESTAKEWEQNLLEIISEENISECFLNNENIKTEPGLFDENGNFWRPDRVVFLKDKTVVIDYKSGQEHPNYKHQVDNYAAILQEMGYVNVKKYLLYLDEPKLVKW